MNIFEPKLEEDIQYDRALRPQTFDDFVGQADLKDKLKIAIQAAKERDEPLDSTLLSSGPGAGKTSLATVIANEYGAPLTTITAPSIKNIGDLLGIVTKLERNSFLFIDEIHSVDKKVEEILYGCIEDFNAHIKLSNKEIVKVNLQPFCCIGATTLLGKLSQPLRDRFGIIHSLRPYSVDELFIICKANAQKLGLNVQVDRALYNIALRSRGIPRVLNRLLRRVRDFCQVRNNNIVTEQMTEDAMELEGIDINGLTRLDKKYLSTILEVFNAGPCGVKPLTASTGIDEVSIKDFIEPWLIYCGYVALTPRGRMLTQKGMEIALNDK